MLDSQKKGQIYGYLRPCMHTQTPEAKNMSTPSVTMLLTRTGESMELSGKRANGYRL